MEREKSRAHQDVGSNYAEPEQGSTDILFLADKKVPALLGPPRAPGISILISHLFPDSLKHALPTGAPYMQRRGLPAAPAGRGVSSERDGNPPAWKKDNHSKVRADALHGEWMKVSERLLFTLHPPLFTLHLTNFTLHPTPSTFHSPPSTLHRPSSTLHSAPSILHLSPFTLHPLPSTLHPPPFTLHPLPLTLHPAPCTLHPPPSTLKPTPSILHPTPSTLHLTP